MTTQQIQAKKKDHLVEKFRLLINSQPRTSCPYLGLQPDQEVFHNFVSSHNKCHCTPTATELAPHYQSSTCLQSSFITCPVYLAKEAAYLHPQRAAAKPTKASLVRAVNLILGIK